MTKKQLIEKMKDFPDNMDIFIEKTNDEFHFSLLENALTKKVSFSDGKLKGKEKVIVLTDEV